MSRTAILVFLITAGCLVTSANPGWAAPVSAKFMYQQNGAVDTSRDARAKGPTADQQKDNKADRKMTQDIRQTVYKDKTLSTMAHQVKIITVGGEVTLRGVVRSEEEKRSIEEKATSIAGAGKVKNEIVVSANNKTDKEANKAESKTKTK